MDDLKEELDRIETFEYALVKAIRKAFSNTYNLDTPIFGPDYGTISSEISEMKRDTYEIKLLLTEIRDSLQVLTTQTSTTTGATTYEY